MSWHETYEPPSLWGDTAPSGAQPPTQAEADAIAALYNADNTLGPAGISERLKLRDGITVSFNTVKLWYHQTQAK
ncbi:hypothetical protein [Microbispora sp. NPDC049125]|uniref:hypothetical protein n=1 Tax=Microbispora sp. NPDC049125 TaxID=3154929 RepID=UPI0034674CE6